MSKKIYLFILQNRLFYRLITGFVVFFLSIAWLLPFLSGIASATSQLTSRSLTISTGVGGATGVQYTYTFTTVTVTTIQSIKFVACQTAVQTYGLSGNTLGSCAAPTGMTINAGTQQNALTGGTGWQNTTGFTIQSSNTGGCDESGNANVLCIKRTATSPNETAVAHTITWNGQTNPTLAGNGLTFYIGVYLYSDSGFSSSTDSGTVASAVVQTLTINAAVAEILNFCVGSTGVDNGSSSLPANCASVSGTSVNLGTLDSGHINITPVSTNCSVADCSKNGLAMIQSNAINGTSVYYDAVQQSGTYHIGTLRISGSTCTNDTINASTDQTDSCFNVRPTAATFSLGTERFGMTVAAVNCSSVQSYSCTFAGGTYNMTRTANYNSTGSNTYTTDSNQISATSNSTYAWDESGTAVQLATSSSSSIKQVDNEGLILKFAAVPAITTPFGVYTAKADFIAVSTY